MHLTRLHKASGPDMTRKYLLKQNFEQDLVEAQHFLKKNFKPRREKGLHKTED